jgi:CDP-glucose 4,6-dehydratase
MNLPDPAFWQSKRVFLTGHTGFKGGWLAIWLASMGAEVHGFALDPATGPNLFEIADVADLIATSTIADIRQPDRVAAAMSACNPDLVLHLAAQPLVRYSYAEPVETYAVNVMGTIHVLEAARRLESVKAILCITTDKCYENLEWPYAYREIDPMGGHDPYSSSKGCAELAIASWRRSYFADSGVLVASARAGNVIGGGDWSADRLVPDALKAFAAGEPLMIRYPDAVRPWQHVLESLAGYLLLAERLHRGEAACASAWNFGPAEEDARPVRWIADRLVTLWGEGAIWHVDGDAHRHEAGYLRLETAKARQQLGWAPRWSLENALSQIAVWHRNWIDGADMRAVCFQQIARYSEHCKDQK